MIPMTIIKTSLPMTKQLTRVFYLRRERRWAAFETGERQWAWAGGRAREEQSDKRAARSSPHCSPWDASSLAPYRPVTSHKIQFLCNAWLPAL